MAGWISATVGFAAPIALAAVAFAQYFHMFLPHLSPGVLSVLVVCLVTGVHLRGTGFAAAFQDVSTIVKLLLIVGLAIVGVTLPPREPVQLVPGVEDWGLLLSSPFAVSLVFVVYSYSGWNAAAYLTSEMRNPSRDLPRALAAGTIVVAVLYVVLNLVFLRTVPRVELGGQLEVALLSGQHLFGTVGKGLVSILVSLGLVASVSAMAWVGPRVMKSMAEDFGRLRWLGRSSRDATPMVGILVQLFIVLLLLATSTFESILIYIQFDLLLCSFLAVLGLLVLRIREPALHRPYKVWLYPFTPLFFLVVTLHMMVFTALAKPWESLCGVATMLLGLALYGLSRGRERKVEPEAPGDAAAVSQ
jgi:APA family basic amino acid/polyamine antiporter